MPRKQFPINTRPPIPEGMREQCKPCAYCGKKESISFGKNDLIYSHSTPIPTDVRVQADEFDRADYRNRAELVEYTGEVSIRTFQYGRFCTQKCAVRFANAAYKAGYRVQK